ncbi:PLP-dependent aminotransferase family protein [Brevibacillus sp. NPDC058079]|uniref:aminotransferase-like domain-containing protein n=1 Tax=Brevibacillus sp. NPDC058079 TaxID=3346330 RepID=UPI0036ECC901
MEWKRDKDAGVPIYMQIAKELERQIVLGVLPPGTSLPPERVLARRFGVNRGTVSAAYEELRAKGILQSWQGSGTWVSRDLWGVKQMPNWYTYTNGGAFLPAYPLAKRIQDACFDSSIINLAKAELATTMIPSLIPTTPGEENEIKLELGYAHPKGEPRLREALAVHLHENYGIHASPDEILVTSGAQQALHLITLCLLNPGDAIAMEGPSYSYSLPLFSSAGLRLFRLPLDEDGIVPEAVYALQREHRIRMVFANPTYHNPTGTILSEARRAQLLDICQELRLPLVEDDTYGALTLAGSPRPPKPIKAIDKTGAVLYVGSLSKTIAPGLRIGWLVGPRSVVERLADAKQQMDFGTSSVSQQFARQFVERESWNNQQERMSRYLLEQQQTMVRAMHNHLSDYAVWNEPGGSYHIWCRLLAPRDEKELLDDAIREGVVFTPGRVYGAEAGWLRLTYSWECPANIEEGIRRIQRVLQQKKR